MTRPQLRVLFAAAALGAPAIAGAQVGYPPERSPFVDLDSRQSVSLFTGWFAAKEDRVGVAPQGGPMVGARYDFQFSGPAVFTARVASVLSDRTVIDPARSPGARVLGTERRPLTLADVGLTLALTGQKSYRGIVPLVHAGVGAVSNFRGADPGGYRFGTAFALAYGLGVRYVPAGRFAFRADVGNHLYQVRYPDAYAAPGLDGTRVLEATASRRAWLNNTAITAGVTYQFRR